MGCGGCYHTAWKVEDIPDPKDPDPVRYAALAGFAEVMALAFNERIDMGIPLGNIDGEKTLNDPQPRDTTTRLDHPCTRPIGALHISKWVCPTFNPNFTKPYAL